MNPYNIIKEIDEKYVHLHESKEIKLGKVLRAQIFPYNEQYYYINTKDIIFPVRIFLRDVRNNGVLYIGYDIEYPGIELEN